jgi:NADPH:quinone reductase-like Zn-dependent oxidoreductase
MKAVCVTENRELEVRDVPTPTDAPSDHVLVDIEACSINHGDKAFLARPRSCLKPLPDTDIGWAHPRRNAVGTILTPESEG